MCVGLLFKKRVEQKKEWPSSCSPSKIRGFESYYSLSISCTQYHAISCTHYHAISCTQYHAISCTQYHALNIMQYHALNIMHSISCNIMHSISCTHYHALMRMMRMRMMRMLMKTNKQTKTNKQIQTSIWSSIKTRISPSIHQKSKIFEKIFFRSSDRECRETYPVQISGS